MSADRGRATRPPGWSTRRRAKGGQEERGTSTTTCTLWPSAAAAAVSPDNSCSRSRWMHRQLPRDHSVAGRDAPSTAVRPGPRHGRRNWWVAGARAEREQIIGESSRPGSASTRRPSPTRSPLAATTVAARPRRRPAASTSASSAGRLLRRVSGRGANVRLNESSTVATDAVSPGLGEDLHGVGPVQQAVVVGRHHRRVTEVAVAVRVHAAIGRCASLSRSWGWSSWSLQ